MENDDLPTAASLASAFPAHPGSCALSGSFDQDAREASLIRERAEVPENREGRVIYALADLKAWADPSTASDPVWEMCPTKRATAIPTPIF
jgi:hypothetical protein